MQRKEQKRSMRRYLQSITATVKPVCKVCFKEFEIRSFQAMSQFPPTICDDCHKKFIPSFAHFELEGVKGMSLYKYDDFGSHLLIRYKENLDIELATVFIDRVKLLLELRYRNYEIILMPSGEGSIRKRGFNHLEEIFKVLKLPIIKDALKKKDDVEQKKLNHIERNERVNFIDILSKIDYRGRYVLLVDDVISTGASLISAIKVLKNEKPKDLKVLCIFRNE